MPSTEEETIIRNGTIKQWLRYFVVIGGKRVQQGTANWTVGENTPRTETYYALEGGLRIRGQWFALLALLIGIALGGWWF